MDCKARRARVLIIDGDGTQTLPIVRDLYRKGHSVHILYAKKMSYGYATRYAERKVRTHPVSDEKGFLGFLQNYVEDCGIDVCIAMSDKAAMVLSKNRETIRTMCRVVAPSFGSFMNGYDKNALMAVCEENGIPHPKTLDMRDVEPIALSEAWFPAILKPNMTTGGRGMRLVEDNKALERVLGEITKQYGDCHLQEKIPSGGRQFKVQIFVAENGEMVASSVIHKQRFYPVSGGSSCFSTTVIDDGLVEICYAVLKKVRWEGFADFDLIEDPRDGIVKILEINPRIPASIQSVSDSGLDYGELTVLTAMGWRWIPGEYVPGAQLRHLGLDLLWFYGSSERLCARPSWFEFFNKRQAFQDLSVSDPLPFLFGTVGSIVKVLRTDFRKAKRLSTS